MIVLKYSSLGQQLYSFRFIQPLERASSKVECNLFWIMEQGSAASN